MGVKSLVPSEDDEHLALAKWLDLKGMLWHHSPLWGKRGKITGAKLKAMGARAGFPDFIIFDVPKGAGFVGAAIELKKSNGGAVTQAQGRWIFGLQERGWAATVCWGAQDAIKWLTGLGY